MSSSKEKNENSGPSAKEHSQARSNGSKTEDLEGKENEWKFREPYKVHDKDDNFKALYEGGCHCGRVKYEISREKPLSAKFCHCTTCQTLHGAPFQWAAIFKKEDINFTHGHHDLYWYESGEKTNKHKLPCKVACAYCGSWIMDEGRNMILMFPSLIKFKSKEERENFRPSMHMFYGQRCVDVRDALPKWEGMGEASELMEEGEGDTKLTREEAKKIVKEKKEKEEAKKKEKEGEGGEKSEGSEKRKREAGNSDANGEKDPKSPKIGGDDGVGEGRRYDLR